MRYWQSNWAQRQSVRHTKKMLLRIMQLRDLELIHFFIFLSTLLNDNTYMRYMRKDSIKEKVKFIPQIASEIAYVLL
jgi:hypothetical protein